MGSAFWDTKLDVVDELSWAFRDSSRSRRPRVVSKEDSGSVCWIIEATLSKSVLTRLATRRNTHQYLFGDVLINIRKLIAEVL